MMRIEQLLQAATYPNKQQTAVKEEPVSQFAQKMKGTEAKSPVKLSGTKDAETKEASMDIKGEGLAIQEPLFLVSQQGGVPNAFMESEDAKQLLLSISDQALTLEKLKASPELLEELASLLQSMQGNTPIAQLPQIQTFLDEHKLTAITAPGQTAAQLLQSIAAQQAAPVAETVSLTADSFDETVAAVQNVMGAADKAVSAEDEKELSATADVLPALATEPGLQHKSAQEGHKAEKVPVTELKEKLQEKVEELQKFVARNERIYMQLDPDRFGTLHVFLRKQGNQIHMHVEGQKQETHKQLESILHDVKQQLKERDIDVQLSYTDREGKQEKQEQRQHKQPASVEKQETEGNQFEGLWEEIQDGN